MDVRNCKSCGRLFNYIGGTAICPSCQKMLEDKFTQVKEYIYDNPNANIQKVSEDNEISIPQIKQWIREERLEFSESSAVGLECENCGSMIRTGRFCQHCKETMANRLGGMYKEKEKQEKPNKASADSKSKMRFLDN